ncbi:uncharacterized protein LOC132730174 [Ruditapes philippinarum]|uniref:uncharacterized protein LOC132730174 n=1 Tax=Ruditapes philippinarum TaxID=129788 RepID=UPI00295ADC83|nr:uncharacterized protein LOC132730174 [Ruditapes philippinarum]
MRLQPSSTRVDPTYLSCSIVLEDFTTILLTVNIHKGYSKAGLSPGVHTKKYADKCMKRRLYKQEKAKLPSTKRRRLFLKKERAICQGANEALEGVSYQSGIGHEVNVDVEKLPDPIPRGNLQPVEKLLSVGGGIMPHITQIAAVNIQSGQKFNSYVIPRLPITAEAQTITGISMADNNTMKVNGSIVEAVPIQTALQNLCVWLEKFSHGSFVAK